MASREAPVQRPSSATAAPVQLQGLRKGRPEDGAYAPPEVHRVLSTSGQPLAPILRSRFERGFSRDFSHVRVHANEDAANSARTVHAKAYTVGQQIVFGSGRYTPDTASGQQLLAHELAHTVQQRDGPARLQREIDQDALTQCIAEQGGSPGYRDGGLPSADELDRYRRDCLSRQEQTETGDQSRALENLRLAWQFARENLNDEIRSEVNHLFSRESLIAMGAFALLYIASQMTPVGWIADAFALTALTFTALFVGSMAIDIARDIYRFFSVVNATTEAEQRAAGQALARALARGGVAIFTAILSRGLRIATRPPPGGPPPTAAVEVLTPNGALVRVFVPTVGEAVEASRIQALASYAVMVPPPGGTEPSSPTSPSQGGSSSASGPQQAGRGSQPPSTGFRLGRTDYGGDALSRLAQQMRIQLGLRRGGNVAVFEFDKLPPGFKELAQRLGGSNVRIEGNRMAVQNVNGSAHSEQLADMLIQAGQRAGLQLNVKSIYTEYNPCTDTCLPLIQQRYPSAQVTFSFVWELWGRQTPDRNAAVDALFNSPRTTGGSQP